MRRITLVLVLIALLLALASGAAASERGAVTIETQKPFGPSPGAFSAFGAIADSGTFVNTSLTGSALGAPTFGILHLTQQFDGALGTFTLRVNIMGSGTADPNVFTDDGTWAVISGTGAYETARGQGTLTGTENESSNLISRTYTGTVHFD
jgi:hypothetical protein